MFYHHWFVPTVGCNHLCKLGFASSGGSSNKGNLVFNLVINFFLIFSLLVVSILVFSFAKEASSVPAIAHLG